MRRRKQAEREREREMYVRKAYLDKEIGSVCILGSQRRLILIAARPVGTNY